MPEERSVGKVEFNLPHGTDIITTVFPAGGVDWISGEIEPESTASPHKLRFGGEKSALRFCIDVLSEVFGIHNPYHLADVTFTTIYGPLRFVIKQILEGGLLVEEVVGEACPCCGVVVPQGTRICENCGFCFSCD